MRILFSGRPCPNSIENSSMPNSQKRWKVVSQSFVWLMKKLSLLFIASYRAFLSPFLGGSCRFEPSCSVYAEEAFRLHHPKYAFLLTWRRLKRCRPGGGFGLDPVPTFEQRKQA